MAMYCVAGSNLFGQWLTNTNSVHTFAEFTNIFDKQQIHNSEISNGSELLFINWAFNLYRCNNLHYVVGAWKGLENQCKLIPVEDKCCKDILMAANDKYLIIINKTTKIINYLNIETDEIKSISLNSETPVEHEAKKLKTNDRILKVCVVNESILFLTSEGHVYSGMLPSYVDTSHCTGKVIDIQCGYEHFLLLTDAGFVYSWGNGRRLQLGHGDVDNEETPTLVEALSGIKIKKIATGGWQSLALSEFGDLYAWGWNDTGQLGIFEKDSMTSYSVPTLVDFYHNGDLYDCNVLDIACGSRHSAVLLEDKTVWTTGNNKYGQLGIKNKDVVKSFEKCFQCLKKCKLKCGYWCTVVYSE